MQRWKNHNVQHRHREQLCHFHLDIGWSSRWWLGRYINYDSKGYPGEAVQVLEDDYQINVKQRTFNGKFKWPEQPDCIFYKRQSIVRTILPPVPVGARNQFEFTQTGIFLLLNWCRQMLQKPMPPVFNPVDLWKKMINHCNNNKSD